MYYLRVDLQCCISFRCTAKWIRYTFILVVFWWAEDFDFDELYLSNLSYCYDFLCLRKYFPTCKSGAYSPVLGLWSILKLFLFTVWGRDWDFFPPQVDIYSSNSICWKVFPHWTACMPLLKISWVFSVHVPYFYTILSWLLWLYNTS